MRSDPAYNSKRPPILRARETPEIDSLLNQGCILIGRGGRFLQRCIGQLSEPAPNDPAQKPAAAAGVQIGKQTVVRESRSQYVSVESFGWDQEGSKVFIYITSGAMTVATAK